MRSITLVFLAAVVPAQAPTLVRDFNTRQRVEVSSDPRGFSALGSLALFSASRPDTGRELLFPGNGNSDAVPLGFAGSDLLFAANDGVVGQELWRLDAGAVSRSLGGGCAAPGTVRPVLVGDDPVLGANATLTISGAPVGTAGFALLGLPLGLGVPLGSGCDLLFDASSAAVLAVAPIAVPTWQITASVPAVPAFVGLSIAVQGVFGPTASPVGADLSNGLSWTFGR